MRKLLFISLAAAGVLLAGCTEAEYPVPRKGVFEARFEQPATRTYLDKDGSGTVSMHWTQGDALSIFESSGSGKYVFDGETGADQGSFSLDTAGDSYTGFTLDRNYAVYPYAQSTTIAQDGTITYEIPAQQSYVSESFGPGAGLMVAVTSSSEDNQLTFKSAVGFLVLKIYGDATVKTITLKGNNKEIINGSASISFNSDGEPAVALSSSGGKKITLNCGESGVQIGTTAATATEFWIAVAPTQFSGGIKVTVTDTQGKETEQSTTNAVTIVRNVYQPMAAFEITTGSSGEPPVIPELPQVSGTLPVLYIYTPDAVPITSKKDWVTGSHAYLKAADGTVTDLGTASIRGRGNTTWNNFDKKPYALKLDNKAALLGMPKDKRWDLLANAVDRTRLRNDIALELGRRLSPDHNQNYFDWTPRGEFVELVLNDTHIGNYYLVEHIKVASNRVPITEMTKDDLAEPAITGGYLMEMSTEMDEVNKFYTNSFSDPYHGDPSGLHGGGSAGTYKLPVMIKDPDETVMQPDQFTWIKNYINGLQGHIISNNSDWDGDWTNEVDMDSFICWMFVQEVVGNYECFHPKSAYMHKDREGKLMMGPLWDFDYATFKDGYASTPVYHYSIWYHYMLKNATFKARVKELWPIVRPLLRDVANNYIETRAAQIKSSVTRDWEKWPTTNNTNLDINMSFDEAVASIKSNLNRRLNQMNTEVDNM